MNLGSSFRSTCERTGDALAARTDAARRSHPTLGRIRYRTLGVGKWNLGHCNETYLPWNRDFDYFLGCERELRSELPAT